MYEESCVDEALLAYKPTDNDSLSLSELKKINEDVVGWLEISDTKIDYPLLQGESDLEYINKNLYNEFVLSGSLYLSCLNNECFKDDINIVYGHRMNNGAMFGDVENYLKQDYFDHHQSGCLYTFDTSYTLRPLASCIVDCNDPWIYNIQNATNKKQMEEFLMHIKQKSIIYESNARFDYEKHKILVCSTCSKDETSKRILLILIMEENHGG